MNSTLTSAQRDVLQRVAARTLGAQATNPQRLSARALASRGLLTVRGRGPLWTATVTDAGRYFLEHNDYPPGHPRRTPPKPPPPVRPEAKPTARHTVAARKLPNRGTATRKPVTDPVVIDSPAGQRSRGRRPHGDELFASDHPDPYDAKILITVKEAAWMLSLPEHAIRQAVADGDLHRVFIGAGTTHYRIVYGSLLGWVNAMPSESGRRSWWA